MVFSRVLAPVTPPRTAALTAAMAGIGMRFATAPAPSPNLEDTLLFGSSAAMDGDDLRVLAVLVSWFGVHAPWVNADRLTRIVALHESSRLRALWSALARWQAKDRRFARLAKLYRAERLDLLAVGTNYQIKRHGEDPRFAGSTLRVPANVLRDRSADDEPPAELARHHHAYRWRLIIGPTYRADMWAALEDDPSLSAAALARLTYGSFATAWHVRRDFVILAGGGGMREPGGRRPSAYSTRHSGQA